MRRDAGGISRVTEDKGVLETHRDGQRELNDLYSGRLSRGRMIWLLALPLPTPLPSVSSWTGDTQERHNYWRERGEGRRWARRLILRPQESLVLYKSFNTLWCWQYKWKNSAGDAGDRRQVHLTSTNPMISLIKRSASPLTRWSASYLDVPVCYKLFLFLRQFFDDSNNDPLLQYFTRQSFC